MITFNWLKLSRPQLIADFKLISHRVVDRNLSVEQLHRILSTHIRTILPIRVSKNIDSAAESGYVYIGGMYYSDWDMKGNKCIEVQLVYNPIRSITITSERFESLCELFADTVLHEIIHMQQYRRRGWSSINEYHSRVAILAQRENQNYLGCTDEIDAYSFNIACELLAKFNNSQVRVINFLNKTPNSHQATIGLWRMYLLAFDYDYSHPIIQRLKKRVIRRLSVAVTGRPYQSSCWINK